MSTTKPLIMLLTCGEVAAQSDTGRTSLRFLGFQGASPLGRAKNRDNPDAWPYRDVKVDLLTCEA